MRFMTYSHDSCGLGHLRRGFAISRHLADHIPGANVLSVIGSTHGHAYFQPHRPNHDYVKIPSVQKLSSGEYRSRHLPLEFNDLIHLRRSILTETVSAFRPDLLIVDKNARGLGGELVPALNRLRSEHPETRIVLGLRDILDDPQQTREEWRAPALVEWLNRIYDAVWIWGEPDVFDAAESYRFAESIRSKTRFVGYLPPEPAKADPEALRFSAGIANHQERLLILTGGGGGDALPKFLAALEGIRMAGAPDVRLLAVAGPLMREDDFAQLAAEIARAAPGAQLVRFLDDFEDWLRAADAVICMGGYNTLREVAAIGKPALVLPRTHPRIEQSLRAREFSAHGWCESIPPGVSAADGVRDFCLRLASGQLHRSLSTLPCRGLRSLISEVNTLLTPECETSARIKARA